MNAAWRCPLRWTKCSLDKALDAFGTGGFVPGQSFTQEDWDEVCDDPEIRARTGRTPPFRAAGQDVEATLSDAEGGPTEG